MEHQTPSGFPGNFRKRKVLGTLWFPSGLPETLGKAKPRTRMKDKVRNKLSKRQHEDEASWSTRSWLSLQAQRMSVALQLAAAEEIATELRLAAASEDAAVA